MDFMNQLKGLFSGFGGGSQTGPQTQGEQSMFGNIMNQNASRGGGGFDIGNMFKNFDMGDATDLFGLGLQGMQYKDSKDMMDYQKKVSEENRRNNSSDRAYNTRVRDENRQLRF